VLKRWLSGAAPCIAMAEKVMQYVLDSLNFDFIFLRANCFVLRTPQERDWIWLNRRSWIWNATFACTHGKRLGDSMATYLSDVWLTPWHLDVKRVGNSMATYLSNVWVNPWQLTGETSQAVLVVEPIMYHVPWPSDLRGGAEVLLGTLPTELAWQL